MLDSFGSRSVKAAQGEQVSLTCELYGYIVNSDMVITWNFDDDVIDNADPLYSITIMSGANSIQNGGQEAQPSIISNLTVLVNSTEQMGTYFCNFQDRFVVFTLENRVGE